MVVVVCCFFIVFGFGLLVVYQGCLLCSFLWLFGWLFSFGFFGFCVYWFLLCYLYVKRHLSTVLFKKNVLSFDGFWSSNIVAALQHVWFFDAFHHGGL